MSLLPTSITLHWSCAPHRQLSESYTTTSITVSPACQELWLEPQTMGQDCVCSIQGYDYKLCTWSPCGQFIAAQTSEAVEIRNCLTLELLTTLKPTETTPSALMGPLAYSPDGHSLACGSNTAILIWDIQTGGIAKEIKCGTDNILMAVVTGWKDNWYH
jgi:WD40 repeat protein